MIRTKPVDTRPTPDSPNTPLLKRVAIVGGSAELMDWLEPLLDAGDYQMLFVDPADAPYAHIRVALPDLVVLTVRIEDLDAFALLSMLKLDAETARIPVVTYTTEFEGQGISGPLGSLPSDRHAAAGRALPLN